VIVLIFFNLGLFTYFIALLTRFFLDGEFIKQYKSVKMHDKIETLSGHVIICGFGRNGKEAAQVLHANHIPYVVVEEREEVDGAKDPEVKYRVKGNATRDEVLLEAGIKSARALISTLPVDADNVFTVLTAKQLNPNIRIISRASQDTSVNKLKVAGANNVIMPDKIGGAHMATLVMIPDVLEFIELLTTRSNEQFKVAELLAEKGSVIGELNLWSSTGCSILGVKNAREYLLNPPPNYYLNPGERLIVMGNEKGISEARRLV
jgi:voltage-gated potassium channel